MATPAPGTIPALPQYQPGALPLTGQEVLEIASSATATAAISAQMPLTDVVGKVPSVMTAAVPSISDLVAFFQVSSGLPRQCAIGNLGQAAGNLPIAGNTGQLLAKNSAANFDDSWHSISTFILGTATVSAAGFTAAAMSIVGSTTVSISIPVNGIVGPMIATHQVDNARIVQRTPLSVCGNSTNATANIADVAASGGNQVLQTDPTGTTLLWGAINLATTIVTGVLPGANYSAVNLAGAGAGGVQGILPGANMSAVNLAATGAGGVQNILPAANVTAANLAASGAGGVQGVLPVPNGGTNTSTLTAHAVLLGAGAATLNFAAATAAGNLLIDQGASSDPGFKPMSGAATISSTGFVSLVNFTATAATFSVVSSTTLVNITGLSAALVTGGVYSVEAALFATAGASGGAQIALACTTAVANIVYQINAYNGSTLVNGASVTALATPLPATTAVIPSFTIVGTITAGNAGTLTAQIAQVAATTTTTIALTGSMLRVLRIA